MPANDKQIDGMHYKKGGEEHWDRAWRLKYDPFQYIITKWIERWRDKGGVVDLEKAQHAIEKYIEVVKAEMATGKKERMETAADAAKAWKRATVMICTCKAPNVLDEDCPTHGSGPGQGYVNQG